MEVRNDIKMKIRELKDYSRTLRIILIDSENDSLVDELDRLIVQIEDCIIKGETK